MHIGYPNTRMHAHRHDAQTQTCKHKHSDCSARMCLELLSWDNLFIHVYAGTNKQTQQLLNKNRSEAVVA